MITLIENPNISIIVPVYNVEIYLRCCIDSILAQTYSNFELLLIDDGSTDASGKICDEYIMKDSRIRVFHKNNGGVSSARNMGLENAKGEWITFVDSDDWVDKDYLENFTVDSDLCVQGYFNGEAKISYENVYVEQHIGAFYMKKPYVFGPYCKLFKTSIIRKNKIEFDVQLSFGEDILFLMQYALYCHNMKVVEGAGYHYRKEVSNSLSVRKRSFEEMALQYSKHLSSFKAVIKGIVHEKCELHGFLEGALCDMLEHYDKSCQQIFEYDGAFKEVFDTCFGTFERILFIKFPKFAIWMYTMKRKIKRHL